MASGGLWTTDDGDGGEAAKNLWVMRWKTEGLHSKTEKRASRREASPDASGQGNELRHSSTVRGGGMRAV